MSISTAFSDPPLRNRHDDLVHVGGAKDAPLAIDPRSVHARVDEAKAAAAFCSTVHRASEEKHRRSHSGSLKYPGWQGDNSPKCPQFDYHAAELDIARTSGTGCKCCRVYNKHGA